MVRIKIICEFCGREISKSNYTKHIRSHEKGNVKENVYHLDHNDLFCKFCKKELSNKNALLQHEIRCSQNPNKIDTSKCFNNGNRPAWNKGLTKETSEILQQSSQTLSKTVKQKLKDFKHIYNEHNNIEIQKWLDYLKTLDIDIPLYETLKHNQNYYMVKGVFTKNENGKNQYIFEHDFLMNIILNGNLEKENTVHHIDNNGLNNSLTNLLVFETNADHKRFHRLDTAWLVYNEITHKFICIKK